MTGSESKTLRIRKWWIVPTLAVLMTPLAIPLATASSAGQPGSGPAVRAAAADDPIVADTRKQLDSFIELWNQNKLDELVAGYYLEDAVMLPPNHEPLHGHAAILAFLKSVHDFLGPFDKGDHLLKATPTGNDSVSWVGQYTFRDGKLRITTHELWVRQPDGSMRNAVDMFGYRDPMS